MDFAQIRDVWTRNGGNPAVANTAAAIALAESGGNPGEVNDNPATGDFSVGLWQINYFGNLRGPRTLAFGSPEAVKDPDRNAAAAIAISGNGVNFSPWTTFTSGRYRQFLSGGGTASSATGAAAGTAPAAPQTLTQDHVKLFPKDWWKVITPGGLAGDPEPSILTDQHQFTQAAVRLAEVLAGGLLMGAGIVLVAYSLLGKELRQSPALLAGVAGGAAGVAESAVIRVRSRPTSAQRTQARSRPRGPERAPGEMRRERAQRPTRVRRVYSEGEPAF